MSSKFEYRGPVVVPTPTAPNEAANKSYVDGRPLTSHASTHAANGTDAVSPASIGAATATALTDGLAGKAAATHAAAHATGGADPVSPASIGAVSATDTRLSVKPYPPVTLTEAATIATDATQGTHFRVTLTANRTLGIPTGGVDGQVCVWEIIASGGARTLTLTTSGGGAFKLSTSVASITATTASTHDFIQAMYSASRNLWLVIAYAKGA